MDSTVAALLGTVIGSIVGGGISYLLNSQRHRYELAVIKEEHRTEYVAEETAMHFLRHKSYTDRSFEVLKKHLGGFTDDELRKILVRAGAVRVYREDGSEWWRLLDRMDEYIDSKKQLA